MNQRSVNNILTYVLVSLLLIASSLVCANDSLDLHDIDQLYDINSAPSARGFFAIPDNTSIDSVFQNIETQDLSEFTPRPNFKTNKRFGLFIPLENKTDLDKWFVHISHYLIDQVDVYVKTENGLEHAVIASKHSNDNTYSINMLGRALPITLPVNESAGLLVVLTSYNMNLPLYIGLIAEPEYQTWKRDMDFMFIVAFGVVLGFVLLSLTSFFIAREQMFLWFAISASLFLFLGMLRSPFGIHLLNWATGLPFWMSIVIGLMQLSMLMFVKSFVSLPANAFSQKLFNWTAMLVVFSVLLSQFSPNSFNIAVHSFLSLVIILLILFVGTKAAINQGALYILFMLGWLPFVYYVGEVIYLQNMTPKLGQSTLNYNNIEGPYFQVFHFFVHFIAMVLRILQIKRDKIAADIKSEAKTTFLAQLSHDLRQPLDTMGLFLDHLQDKIHNKESATLLTKTKLIHRSMRDMLKGLLDLSQLEAGKMSVTMQDVNIHSLFEDIRCEYEQNARVKNLAYRSRGCAKTVKTDRVLLKRLLGNLLSNATKYTACGGMLLSARCRKDHVLLQVWDTGKGIDEHEQHFVFDLYQRSESNDINIQSTGVGLATVQHIALLLGFKVRLRSTLGQGSVFSVYIPCGNERQEIT